MDAAYAPFFQRFFIAEAVLQTGLLNGFPRLKAWAEALLSNDVIKKSVVDDFEEQFRGNLKRREFYVATLFDAPAAAAE